MTFDVPPPAEIKQNSEDASKALSGDLDTFTLPTSKDSGINIKSVEQGTEAQNEVTASLSTNGSISRQLSTVFQPLEKSFGSGIPTLKETQAATGKNSDILLCQIPLGERVGQDFINQGRDKIKKAVEERKGARLLRKLIRGKEKTEDGDKKTDGKGDPSFKTDKIEFPEDDPFRLIKELHVPEGFKDPGDNDNFQRDYLNDKTDSRISYYNGRLLDAGSQGELKDILSKHKGTLRQNSPEMYRAAALIGGGYHRIHNNPQISVETVAGKKVLVLSDQDPKVGQAGYTILAPSESQKSVNIVSFSGTIGELPAAKQAFQKMKWYPGEIQPPPPVQPNRNK